MAKFHVALVRVPFSNVASPPVYDFEPIAQEIINTATSSLSTIFPSDDNQYWVVTPIDGDGWASLGAYAASGTPPAPTPALEKGWPVFTGLDRAWKAPKRRRLGITAV
ncbi:hypothetical protein EVC24_022 [Rhizobium phage RHph_I4]|nr:hypothetical protein EVC24_022 [Rhizobium phage RHph_I4]